MPLITLLVYLVIFLIVAGLLYWLLTMLPLPEPFKRFAIIVFVVLCIIVLLVWFLQMAPGSLRIGQGS
jgi:hypothetical protein